MQQKPDWDELSRRAESGKKQKLLVQITSTTNHDNFFPSAT